MSSITPPAGSNKNNDSESVRKLRRFGFLVFTVAFTVVLVKLGFWQLGRGAEKAELIQVMAQREQTVVTSPRLMGEKVKGIRVEFNGTIETGQSLLLDNQTHKGIAGYRWFAPMTVGASTVLLELGWLPAPKYRSELPAIQAFSGTYKVTGIADIPSPMVTLSETENMTGWPKRVQRIDLPRFENQTGISVMPWIIRADAVSGIGSGDNILPSTGAVHVWQPVVMKPEKHYAYALQWFGLAAVVVIGTVIWWRRSREE
ncbi:SURF1 family protein [Veronia pacifica]|uniref:SURF1-like protein n=1 Tax=Veronia pacifica TaxID=1080227 RepID=A0A1C3EJB5_9GAMM|nr:SURF1 family protein [Veronia pacifica]ODA33322.1 hypothetical protein A8L45_10725 [Veronia pacifica]